MSYYVKIIRDSINLFGNRLTTFELSYPRFVHAELLTHRMFSRNSSSSRAIPTRKFLDLIREDPALPLWWGKNQSGMQAREELQGAELSEVQRLWIEGRDLALNLAERMHLAGAHKQIVNRVLEPWMFIKTIISATELENWFHLRDSELAQPEIAWIAREMRRCLSESTPERLPFGAWHLPYVDESDEKSMRLTMTYVGDREQVSKMLRKVSVARCARVSYMNHGGERSSLKEDARLHDKLSSSKHWSPFEHVARAMCDSGKSGNFFGWEQYRKLFSNENFGRSMQ